MAEGKDELELELLLHFQVYLKVSGLSFSKQAISISLM